MGGRAQAGKGSVFHEVVAENQLFWGAGDQIVFPWERDGWTHLYSVPARGGVAKLLTPGEFEVEYVSLSSSRAQIVFSSNQDDIDHRHVWRVSPGADHPAAGTSGAGIETAPVTASDNKTVLVLRSDAHIPMRPAVIGGKGALFVFGAGVLLTAVIAAAISRRRAQARSAAVTAVP